MWFFLFIVVALGAAAAITALTIGQWRNTKDSNKVRDAALDYLDDMADKYEDFLRKRLTLAYVKDEDWQSQQDLIIREAKEVVKPDIDALAAFIAGFPFKISPTTHQPSTFRNMVTTAEELLSKSPKRSSNEIRSLLYTDFEDAMRSDLSRRWLDFQVGEQLSPR